MWGGRRWHPTPVLLPGKSHGWRSLVGCSPWGFEESDMTERLHFHFSLSCIGEGNGNPLQCSCLENPRDGGAWWAAIYEVAQSWTRLKRLSGSSSSNKVSVKLIIHAYVRSFKTMHRALAMCPASARHWEYNAFNSHNSTVLVHLYVPYIHKYISLGNKPVS